MKQLAQDFKDFLLKGNLVSTAVALVMALVFANVVKALISDIITPIIALIVGKPNFGNLFFTIHHSQFHYGDFINYLITFVSTGLAVFFFIVKPYSRFEKKEEPTTKDCPNCFSAIPMKATRCPACTSELTAAA